jgi:acyl-CoA thioesterase-1
MLKGVIGNSNLMSPDGVHPNAAGATMIATTVWSHLRPLAESLVVAAD